jgi:hypothetical protein
MCCWNEGICLRSWRYIGAGSSPAHSISNTSPSRTNSLHTERPALQCRC